MHCPYCKNEDTKVLDSRVADDGGSIRRRRTCSACDRRFTTVEKMQLTVLKRSGATEPSACHSWQGAAAHVHSASSRTTSVCVTID